MNADHAVCGFDPKALCDLILFPPVEKKFMRKRISTKKFFC
jgi:hypothetical protein